MKFINNALSFLKYCFEISISTYFPAQMKLLKQESKIKPIEIWLLNRLMVLCKKIPLSQASSCTAFLAAHSSIRFYAKNEIVSSTDISQDSYMYFVHSGIAKTYTKDATSGKLHIKRIWTMNEVIFDLNAFLNDTAPVEHVKMLDPGYIASISYASIRIMIEENPEIMSLLLWLQADRECQFKYFIELMALSVADRVTKFLSDNPAVESRVRKETIAIYLGISRSRFSKAVKSYHLNSNEHTRSSAVNK
jgi:CRP-like cAMP-binding protein